MPALPQPGANPKPSGAGLGPQRLQLRPPRGDNLPDHPGARGIEPLPAQPRRRAAQGGGGRRREARGGHLRLQGELRRRLGDGHPGPLLHELGADRGGPAAHGAAGVAAHHAHAAAAARLRALLPRGGLLPGHELCRRLPLRDLGRLGARGVLDVRGSHGQLRPQGALPAGAAPPPLPLPPARLRRARLQGRRRRRVDGAAPRGQPAVRRIVCPDALRRRPHHVAGGHRARLGLPHLRRHAQRRAPSGGARHGADAGCAHIRPDHSPVARHDAPHRTAAGGRVVRGGPVAHAVLHAPAPAGPRRDQEANRGGPRHRA
mmetsp:Transcript_29949/g.95715  ORF Transcript_29949/g.95715 Transcript_29949/m.95715 type:complete len:317 (-) Transcript_29949:207-1157(-)